MVYLLPFSITSLHFSLFLYMIYVEWVSCSVTEVTECCLAHRRFLGLIDQVTLLCWPSHSPLVVPSLGSENHQVVSRAGRTMRTFIEGCWFWIIFSSQIKVLLIHFATWKLPSIRLYESLLSYSMLLLENTSCPFLWFCEFWIMYIVYIAYFHWMAFKKKLFLNANKLVINKLILII